MSRMVSRRAQAARRVHQSAITHADGVGARLDAELAAAGVEAPPTGGTIRALGALIIARAEAMERADRAHDEELSDDAEPRHARDLAFEELTAAFANLRDVIGVVGGPTLVKRIGLAGRTPRTPDDLIQAAKIVHGRLAEIPIPQTPGLAVDPAALAAGLEGRISALGQALIDVDREAREAEATQQAKNEAIAAYDQAFSGAAAALSALFVLADEADLARRVRPSRSRPGQTLDGEEGDGADVEAPAAAADEDAAADAVAPAVDGPAPRPLAPLDRG